MTDTHVLTRALRSARELAVRIEQIDPDVARSMERTLRSAERIRDAAVLRSGAAGALYPTMIEMRSIIGLVEDLEKKLDERLGSVRCVRVQLATLCREVDERVPRCASCKFELPIYDARPALFCPKCGTNQEP